MTRSSHFLEVINSTQHWHYFSKLQDGNIVENAASLLAMAQEDIRPLNHQEAQNIFIAMCQQVTATIPQLFVPIERDDIKAGMNLNGYVWLSSFSVIGHDQAEQLASKALYRSLMPTITKAKKIIGIVYGKSDLGLDEYETICSMLGELLNENGSLNLGFMLDDRIELNEKFVPDDTCVHEIQIKLMAFGCE